MSREHPPQDASIDHRSVDWRRVRRATYHLRQRFSYEYPGPIADLRQQLIVVPNDAHGGQRLIGFEVASEPATARRLEERDPFGNRVVRLQVDRVEQAIAFAVSLDVERHAADDPRVPAQMAGTYLRQTALTDTDGALRQAARRLASRLRGSVEERATAINHWVHEQLRYERDLTGIRTTAAEAFALGGGVCQDFAHVMLSVCRCLGIAARYVSGHLLGEGGTHAWVEVLVPAPDGSGELVARAFDPTHGRAAGLSYITVATGRDYRDVAPTSGTFSASYSGVLRASKRAVITSVEYEDDEDQDGEQRGAA